MPSEPAHVLFVDDDRNCLAGISRSLRQRRSDLRLSLVDDPRDVLTLIGCDRPDAVISDMQMPHMSGLEVLGQVRDAEPDVPCMILSGAADLPTAIAAINELQIFRFLTKPCDGGVLSAAIDAALEASKMKNGTTPAGNLHGPQEMRLDAAFDYLSMGLLVLDGEGKLHHANQRARGLLGDRDGLLTTPTGHVRAATQAESDQLMRCVRVACENPAPSALPAPASISRPSMKRDLSLFAVPMPVAEPAAGQSAMAGVFILDPENHDTPPPDVIAGMFDLTSSEASIVCDLVTGASLETAADRAGVTLSTARTYLKRTFAKTGTSKQTELTSLVIRSTFGVSNPAAIALS